LWSKLVIRVRVHSLFNTGQIVVKPQIHSPFDGGNIFERAFLLLSLYHKKSKISSM